MRAQKNKVLSKGKTRIVGSNDKVNPDLDKASPEPEACPSLEASPVPEEASPSPEEVTADPDIGIDLTPEWAEYEENYSSDQDEMPEGINHSYQDLKEMNSILVVR